MSWATESSVSSICRLPSDDTSTSHPALMGEAFNDPLCSSFTDEAQVIESSDGGPEGYESQLSCAPDASAVMNEAGREERHKAELQETKQEGDDDDEDSNSESTMEEFGLKYNEDSDAGHESNDESDGASEYGAPSDAQPEPMRARNRSGPPIPPPVPVRPGQLFFSNQIWTRLNVEQQLKLGALKVGSKNKSFKTRPWLVVEKSDRVDSDGQQMLWVMCCTTRNRNGWEGVSYRDSKSFIPMAPTPSRFGRPVLPLVADDREVFLGGSLLFLEVFKEIKPSLLGDYIGHISDESVSIVNREQSRIAEERRKKEELRAANTAALKARGGSHRKANERCKLRAETRFDQSDNRGNSYSGHQCGNDGGIISGPFPPFQFPPGTNGTHVSPPLNPTAPSFRDPTSQGHRGNRRKSLSSRGMQNRQQQNYKRQNYSSFNQTLDSENRSAQTYGGNYGNFGGYSSPGSYGSHEDHGNNGRRRSSTGGHGGYTGPQGNYGGRPSSGYYPDNGYDTGRVGPPARDGSQPTWHASGATSRPSGNIGNNGWGSGDFHHGGSSWTTARQYQRR